VSREQFRVEVIRTRTTRAFVVVKAETPGGARVAAEHETEKRNFAGWSDDEQEIMFGKIEVLP